MDKIKKRQYRTIDQIDEQYYRHHPDEIDSYLRIAFEEGCDSPMIPDGCDSLLKRFLENLRIYN